jgi:hypothetical protein
VSNLLQDKRIVLPVAMVLLVIAVIWYGDARLAAAVADAERIQRSTVNEVVRFRRSSADLREELAYLQAQQGLDDVLRSAGFTDMQDRLATSAAVDALASRYRIGHLRISLAPEEALRDRPYTGTVLELVSTPVTVDAKAASLADMRGFLAALPGVFSGVATVESLQWRRQAAMIETRSVLRWETVRRSEGGS